MGGGPRAEAGDDREKTGGSQVGVGPYVVAKLGTRGADEVG